MVNEADPLTGTVNPRTSFRPVCEPLGTYSGNFVGTPETVFSRYESSVDCDVTTFRRTHSYRPASTVWPFNSDSASPSCSASRSIVRGVG